MSSQASQALLSEYNNPNQSNLAKFSLAEARPILLEDYKNSKLCQNYSKPKKSTCKIFFLNFFKLKSKKINLSEFVAYDQYLDVLLLSSLSY